MVIGFFSKRLPEVSPDIRILHAVLVPRLFMTNGVSSRDAVNLQSSSSKSLLNVIVYSVERIKERARTRRPPQLLGLVFQVLFRGEALWNCAKPYVHLLGPRVRSVDRLHVSKFLIQSAQLH